MTDYNNDYANVFIRSLDRDTTVSSSSTNFVVRFDKYQFPHLKFVKLINFIMPNSIYNFTTSNNTIYFRENATNKTATVTPGFYTADTLATTLASILTTASGGFNTYTVTYSAITGKLTFSAGSNFQFMAGTNPTFPYRELGITQADTVAATSLTSTNCVSLERPVRVYLSMDLCDEPILIGNATATSDASFSIPVDVNFMQVVDYEPTNEPIVRARRTNPDQITFKLKDGFGNLINLNGLEWTVQLAFISEKPNCRGMCSKRDREDSNEDKEPTKAVKTGQ